MGTTTLAATAPRTAAVAAPAKKLPIAPHMLPNAAGQVGPIGVKSGIVGSLMKKAGR